MMGAVAAAPMAQTLVLPPSEPPVMRVASEVPGAKRDRPASESLDMMLEALDARNSDKAEHKKRKKHKHKKAAAKAAKDGADEPDTDGGDDVAPVVEAAPADKAKKGKKKRIEDGFKLEKLKGKVNVSKDGETVVSIYWGKGKKFEFDNERKAWMHGVHRLGELRKAVAAAAKAAP